MTSFVFPVLRGLTFDVARTPQWNTEIAKALSAKRSSIALMAYPEIHFELTFSVLRDDLSPSDVKAVVGLFNACAGGYDTFLFSDPDFNTVQYMRFATSDGTQAFQLTATYENTSGPGGAEIIQNFNGAPSIYQNRYGTLLELCSVTSRTQLLLQSQSIDNASWTKNNCTITANITAAPDLSITADAVVENTNTNVAYQALQSVTVLSSIDQITFSFFVKASTRSWHMLQMKETTGNTVTTAWFNTSTSAGAVGTISTGANWSGTTATITACNVGLWFRVTITSIKTNAATTVQCVYQPATADNTSTYTGTIGTTATYIWGAQCEIGPAATLYLPSTTSTVGTADYAVGATGIVTFTQAPAPNGGNALYWSGSFYYRCAFDEDKLDLVKFMNQWWSIKKLPFTSIKL